jgi:hypothetical protein
MPSLKELLKNKSDIKEIAEKLGFIDSTIRVAKYGQGQLTLIVEEDNNKKLDALPAPKIMCLENWLIHKYQALFCILAADTTGDDSIIKSVVNESVNIDKEQDLIQLFGNLDVIKIHEGVPEEIELISELQGFLEPTVKTSKETQTSNSPAAFFPDSKSNEKKRNLDEVVNFALDHREQFKAALSNMTDDQYQDFNKRLKSSPDLPSSPLNSRIKSH